MKLRIRGNTLRLRLTQSEVAQFVETGAVKETVEFGAGENQKLVYALAAAENIKAPRAVLENNQITVFLPKEQAETWTQTNQVGIRAEQQIDDSKILQILIEKDFACLEKRAGDDDADAFPHPLKTTGKLC